MQKYLRSVLATGVLGSFAIAAGCVNAIAAKVPVAEQEYIWVAANVSHPFYAEGKAGWDAAAKSLGVKATLAGPEAPDVQQQIALIEAACMRAVLTPAAFRSWFARFLPQLAQHEPATLFAPAHISDRSDGRIVHLDGLNLSRAWCWLSIAESLALDNPIRSLAARTADRHLAASLPFLTHHYMGEHWLASFALLALRPPPGRLRREPKSSPWFAGLQCTEG